MQILISKITAITKWPVAIFFMALFLLFVLVLFPASAHQVKERAKNVKLTTVDAITCPDASTITEAINKFKENAVSDIYVKTEIQKDIAFPFVYSILLSLLLCAVFIKWKIAVRWKWIILLPFIATVTDLLENFSVVTMLYSSQNRYGLTATVCSMANCVKYITSFLCLGLLVAGLAWNLQKTVSNCTGSRRKEAS